MENPDLRKEAMDAVRGIKGDLKGLIVLATDEEKSAVCVGGKPTTIISMLAGAMLKDPHMLAIIHEATAIVAAKITAKLVANN